MIPKLKSVFSNAGHYKSLLNTHNSDVQSLLDAIQLVSNNRELDPAFKRNLVVAAQRLSKKSGFYPAYFQLKDVTQISDDPVASGGFGDIYKGTFKGQIVCIKALRIYDASNAEYTLKELSKEAILWGQIQHPNILIFYGVYRFRNRPCLVAPWMRNGDIGEYLKKNPNAPRCYLVDDIAYGLKYLHGNGIIHGDLKGLNILVDDVGRVRVSDFGISSISDSKIINWSSNSSAASKGGSVRWQAPELFEMEGDEVAKNSVASDMYAWGCVCYEVFTGTIPFSNVTRDSVIILQVQRGTRPAPPPISDHSWKEWDLTESIWSLIQDCRKAAPEERPTIAEAIHRLGVDRTRDTRLDGSYISPIPFREGMSGHSDETAMSILDHVLEVILGADTTPESSLMQVRDQAMDSLALERATNFFTTPYRPNRPYDSYTDEPEHILFASGAGPTIKSSSVNQVDVRRTEATKTGAQPQASKGRNRMVHSIAFSPNGRQIVLGSYDTSVQLWDIESINKPQFKRWLKGHTSSVRSVVFSPDGSQIASGSEDRTVPVWDVTAGMELMRLKGHASTVTSVAFSPDGLKIVSSSDDSKVCLWDTRTSGSIWAISSGQSSPVTSIAFSLDGTRIALGIRLVARRGIKMMVLRPPTSSVRLWDAATGMQLAEMKGHTSVTSVAFSPDGTRIVAGSDDTCVRLWNAATGVQLKKMRGHTSPVTSVAFSPDGSQIASSSDDTLVKVWDAATGLGQVNMRGHISPVTSVAFSPDGMWIASSSNDEVLLRNISESLYAEIIPLRTYDD